MHAVRLSETDPATTPQAAREAAIVAKAALAAAERLGINARALAGILGLSEATLSRLKSGAATLDRSGKPFELAVLFVRLYRSLDAIVGGDEAVARAWLRNDNMALGAVPLQHIRSVSGLVDVIAYLDARRAVV